MTHTPLGEHDYQRLSATLDKLQPQGCMNLEQLDGFFTALICGPDPIKPAECLPLVLGEAFDDDTAFTAKSFDQFTQLLTQHWHDIYHTINNKESFYPWLAEREDNVVGGNDWALGFTEGMQLLQEDWALLFDDNDSSQALEPILALAFEHDPDPQNRPQYTGNPVEQHAQWVDQLSDAVAGIHVFFSQIRQQIADLNEQEEQATN